MPFPYTFSSSFDTGSNAQWDSESDTGSKLDFPHYSELARIPGRPMPYRGAYCMRIADIADTNDHTLTEGDMNAAAAETCWTRFALYVSPDFSATADDIFNIFELQATGTVEGAISLQITAATDLVEIGVGETAASSFPSVVTKGEWHIVELRALVDSGVGNDGVLELFLDGASIQTVSTLDQGAITDGVLGTQNTLATTDVGYLLFDEFAFDAGAGTAGTRLGIPANERFTTSRLITRDSFLFVGPGRVNNIKVLDGGSGDVSVELYDTDRYTSSLSPKWRDRTSSANANVDAADVPIDFKRGCLAVLGGTLPGAIVHVHPFAAWGSDGAIRGYALRRKELPGGI